MREVLTLIGAGIVIALPIAWALSHMVQAQLYGTKPGDPLSIGLATLLLSIVSAVAGCLPARRAAASQIKAAISNPCRTYISPVRVTFPKVAS
jgi:ABC-type antimicrobial peptide transport system permease subunit